MLAVLALASCSGEEIPDPVDVVADLAAGLSSGDVSEVAFSELDGQDAQKALAALIEGMGQATVDVVPGGAEVLPAGDAATPDVRSRATAVLELTWDLDGDGPVEDRWEYRTEAGLELVDDPGAGEEGASAPTWQVVWDPALVHPELVPGARLELEREQAPRAQIVGAEDAVLVTDRPVERVGIDKVRLEDMPAERSARRLASVVAVDQNSYVEAVEAAGPEAFVEAIVLRRPEAKAVRAEVEAIPGGRLLSDRVPLAPTREFARALLGTVGEATAEIIESAAGAVVAGDVVGLSGLQAEFDVQLRGTPALTVVASSPEGVGSTVHRVAAVPGRALATTLEARTQQLADDLLQPVRPPSALVAIRPSTGELLAVASGPGGDGYSTATLGQYAPGSVFKVVTTLALLRAGLDAGSELPCTETITIDGREFSNYSDFPLGALGDLPLRRAFAESCNTAFISTVDTLEPDDLAGAASSLRIGTPSDAGFDAFWGDLGERGRPEDRVAEAASLIGQGDVLLSPLAAATMAASTLGGADWPVLLPDVPADYPPGVAVSKSESQTLQQLMRETVRGGTASLLADVPGPAVGAKTGTAEYGTRTPPDTHGWMVAVQGDLAVAVFVEQAESGSATAGPILKDFLVQVGRLP